MNSLRMNKAASIFTTFTAAAAIALGATGCVFTGTASLDDDADVVYVEPDPDPTPVAAVSEITIDSGATTSADPGNGVGVFVQYDEGGYWTLFTTCDTEISGSACDFDVLISADPSVFIDNVEGFDLDPADSITLDTDGSINLVTRTTYGMDGITFDADPGAIIRVDVLLDGIAQPEFVYVLSNGRLLSGVPTNPVDFVPATP